MGCGASTNSNPNISNGNIESNGGVPNNFQGPNTTGVSRKITSVKPYRHGSPITQADLETRRNVFWGTQVQGNADMWNALRTASNALLNQDYNLANAILEASNISTPNASLEICYDERGFEYKVPIFCYSKPIELSNANTLPEANLVSTNPKPNTIITAAPLHLRVRVNPGDYNLQVDASTADSILALKRTILEQSQEKQAVVGIPICEENRQRIMFLGKELQNAQLLGEVGLDDSKVVQVFLRPTPADVLATTTTVIPKAP